MIIVCEEKPQVELTEKVWLPMVRIFIGKDVEVALTEDQANELVEQLLSARYGGEKHVENDR